MKKQKIIAQILISFVFLQATYAQEFSEHITSKKTLVENSYMVYLRDVPGIHEKKTYSVMQGVIGSLTGKEVKKDNLTWVEVEYNHGVKGWAHKSLLGVHALSYTTQTGNIYTVYYTLSEKEKALFGATSNSGSSDNTSEEIVWITTDLRVSGADKTNYDWLKKETTQTGMLEEETSSGQEENVSTNTMQDFSFRDDTIKFNVPWAKKVPVEVSEEIVQDQEVVSEVPVMVTSDFHSDVQIKFQGPWANKEAFEFTGSTDSSGTIQEISTNTMQDFSFRDDTIKFNVPWAKPSQTGSTETQTGSEVVVEEVKASSITSTIQEEFKKYFLGPWAEKEAFEFTGSTDSSGTTQEISQVPSDITSTFSEEVKYRDLYTFMFGK